jgi:hypothetical protein
MQSAFPTPEDDDAEDVAWGLTTGAALWKQGERYDAIVWLKRAVEAANEAGAPGRADQLNRAATDLIASLAVPPRSSSSSSMKTAAPSPSRSLLPSAPASAPRLPSAPALAKAAPVPPRPPPPPRLKTPPSFEAAPATTAFEDVAARASMPSVTTSAPTIEVLTQHATQSAGSRERVDPPPPPTIVPDFEAAPPPVETAAGETEIEIDVDATPLPQEIPAVRPSSGSPVIDLTSVEDAPLEVRAGIGVASPALLAALDALPLTTEQRRKLADTAIVESLAAEEDVSVSSLALVVNGQACAQARVSDVTAVAVRRGELLYAKSSIDDSLSLRLVAETDPTTIAHWDHGVEELLADTPDLLDRLKRESDRTQAIAGCTMGPLGEQLDEGLRAVAIDKLDVLVLSPGEVIATKGQPVPGMVIVGVGVVEVEVGDDTDRLGPGDFLFATEVLGGGAAPGTARAGAKGAIVLFGARAAAHELLVTCPPLLEVFAGM